MRAIVQRVVSASVEVDGRTISEIGSGILVLVGLHESDVESDADYICRKVLNMRLFPNEKSGKTWDQSVMQKNFGVLLVSQVTLYGFLKGNKPDFHVAMSPQDAEPFYESLVQKFRNSYNADAIKDGVFGAMMKVHLVNDGPVTMQLDSSQPSKGLNDCLVATPIRMIASTAPIPKMASTTPILKMASSDSGRVSWKDPDLIKLFLKLCIEEANGGGRSGGSLKKESWNKVREGLKGKRKLDVNQKQLKNQWDYLKKKYGIWSKLVGMTGHDFNASTNTVDWPAEKWDDYIKVHPEAKQFRHSPLQFVDEMRALFDGIRATGDHGWGPVREGMLEDCVGSSTQPAIDLSQFPMEIDPQIPLTPSTSHPRAGDEVVADADSLPRDKPLKKKKKFDDSNEIEAILKSLAKVSDNGPGVIECNDSLNEMTLLTKTDPLYVAALTIFCEKKEYRAQWMEINEEEVRIAWLKMIATKLGLI